MIQAEILGVNIQQFAERRPGSDSAFGRVGRTRVNPTSRRKAAELVSLFGRKGTDFHVVVCSPYSRCVQTAVKICKHLGDLLSSSRPRL